MRLLLDTNIVIPMIDGRGRELPDWIRAAVTHDEVQLSSSVASIWEIAIKHRLGKPLPCSLLEWPGALASLNIQSLPVRTAHVVREAVPHPPTRDPFDRLFLAICAVDQMRLVTIDSKLINHPLAWQPA